VQERTAQSASEIASLDPRRALEGRRGRRVRRDIAYRAIYQERDPRRQCPQSAVAGRVAHDDREARGLAVAVVGGGGAGF